MRNSAACPIKLANLDDQQRTVVLDELQLRRLIRKSERMVALWESTSRDWNQTLLLAMAITMGSPYDKEPFEAIARRATYQRCMKESGSKLGVEALFLGCSALLDSMDKEEPYLAALQAEYEHLNAKYGVGKIDAGLWTKARRRPWSSALARVAQLAAIVAGEKFSFDYVLSCCTMEDVSAMLAVDVGDFWAPRCGGRRLGRNKIEMMAINMLVTLQIAYGRTMGQYDGTKALNLLAKVPAEQNRIVSRWTGYGVRCSSACDSQALIELQSFCDLNSCDECPLAKVVEKR